MMKPEFRVKRDRKGWGVQAKWPRSGPWHHTQIWPRWVWHGPFGATDARWADSSAALLFANVCERHSAETLAKLKGQP